MELLDARVPSPSSDPSGASLPASLLIRLPRALRLFATRRACFHPEPNIETGKPFFRWIWFSIHSILVDNSPHGADDKAIEKFRLVDAIAGTVGGEVAAKLIAKVTQQDFLMDHGRLA